MYPALYETELHEGEQDHHDHQDYRLRRGATEILAAETVIVDLPHQDVGGLAWTTLGQRADDAEGAEEGVDDVDHQQEEAGGRQQRENDVPEAPAWAGPVDGGGLDQGLGDRLKAGEEEQEVVA